MKLLSKIFSTKHEKDIKRIMPLVHQINKLEPEMEALTDEDFKIKTEEYKSRLADGEKPIKLLPEAFALVREAAKRTMGMRHFDVQLIGGVVLFEGKIAEMKTGEGKTLVATLTAYLRALEGKGVHVITVNDHLAKRDAEWMLPVFEFLGMGVGYIINGLNQEQRRQAYAKDITYGTNNEFGFDYLRDNMVSELSEKAQRQHYFCIVDEVDSILIDESRTPLIISGPSELNTDKYYSINKIIPRLKEAKQIGKDDLGKEIYDEVGDYVYDIKDKNITITEIGVVHIEEILKVGNLYSPENTEILHHVNQALKAYHIFKLDVDYIVEGGEVVIIDEFTGRKMAGRRFSDGLHQAIEAKENVAIQSENQTIATITFQNYFRMYKILSGMTGTADTEAEEFNKIYSLDVVVIPTNKPIARIDQGDKIYRTEKEKFNAIVERTKEAYDKGQPVLIGTASVEKSEELSHLLTRKGLKHNLLNAKHHQREAMIVKDAGEYKAITIATNMAGRGTDIKLKDEIKELGGLLIIGSERHDSRRIDNQLRGRSGRQGNAGESIFYISLEDELMKRFHSEKISNLMLRLGMKEGEEIEHPWISKQIAMAQKKVEGRNFDIRKYLLEYDDVMNVQRTYIYKQRNGYLEKKDLFDQINLLIEEVVEEQLELFSDGARSVEVEFINRLELWLDSLFDIELKDLFDEADKSKLSKQSYNDCEDRVIELVKNKYAEKRKHYQLEVMQQVERYILIQTIDGKWKEHLLNMDHLREGINLRSYAEKKPIVEFKSEGFKMFQEMILNCKYESLEKLFLVKLSEDYSADYLKNSEKEQSEYEAIHQPGSAATPMFSHSDNPLNDGTSEGQGGVKSTRNQVINKNKVGRNEPCPCGSGKKYKACHGRN